MSRQVDTPTQNGAQSENSGVWRGGNAVYSTSNGDYIKITATGGGKYSVSFGQSYELLRGFDSMSETEVKEFLGLLAADERARAAGGGASESTKESASNSDGDVITKRSFTGYAADGKGMYVSNFPKGTPKAAKSKRILKYIQDVWSKKPIKLNITDADGKIIRTIEAKFDPTYDETKNAFSDATKLMGGNRHGSASEQRVTLDLADDYYQIASESRYNYSKAETGKQTNTHADVKEWHYFVNDILFAEQGSKEYTPYRVTINVKEKNDGNFVYSFSAEKSGESNTPRTLHAEVKGAKSSPNVQLTNNSISSPEPVVKKNISEENRKGKTKRDNTSNNPANPYDIQRSDIEYVQSLGKKNINDLSSAEISRLEKFAQRLWDSLEFDENGKRTGNGIKSPFFRTWQGDWRAHDTGSAKSTEIGPDKTINRESRSVKNSDTNWNLKITDDAMGDSIHYAGKEKQYIERLLSNIDVVLERAIFLDTATSSRTSNNKSSTTQLMHYFYAIVEYNKAPFLAKIAVEEYDVDGKRRAYNVERIKMSALSRAEYSSMKDSYRVQYASNADGISIADLHQLVKTYDPKFSPKPVNKVLLNADGTPKVFYHGTNQDFSVFQTDGSTSRASSDKTIGTFFAESREYAAMYAKEGQKRRGGTAKVYEAYLKSEKLFDTRDNATMELYEKRVKPLLEKRNDMVDGVSDLQESELPTAALSNEIINILKTIAPEYDGFVFDEGDGTPSYVVLNSNQIKSATDNIGTFDGSNPDIRYSLSENKTARGDAEGTAERAAKATNTAEKKVGKYTAAEQDAARDAVKNFDMYEADTRRAVLEFIRSTEGRGRYDKKTVSAICGIIVCRPELSVLATDLEKGTSGMHVDLTAQVGRRLVLLDSKGDSVKLTALHEAVHDIEGTEGYSRLKRAALKYTSSERKAEIIDMYAENAGAKKFTEWLGERKFGDEALREYLKQNPKLSEEGLFSEIVAKTVAESLNKADFLDSYSNRSMFSQIISALKRLGRYLSANEQSKTAQRKTAELIVYFREAMGEGYRSTGNITQKAIRYGVYPPEAIDQNIRELANMSSVHNVDASKLEKTGKKPSDIFTDFFNSLGNSIETSEFGDISLGKSSVKSEIRHGITAEKIASIEAIPQVLRNGKVIFIGNKGDSGNGVERLVVAAPIKIGTNDYYMGVMLQRDPQSQKLYLHNVAIEKEIATASINSRLTTKLVEDNDNLSITSILQNALLVKSEVEKSKVKTKKSLLGTSENTENETKQAKSNTAAKAERERIRKMRHGANEAFATNNRKKIFSVADAEIYGIIYTFLPKKELKYS